MPSSAAQGQGLQGPTKASDPDICSFFQYVSRLANGTI